MMVLRVADDTVGNQRLRCGVMCVFVGYFGFQKEEIAVRVARKANSVMLLHRSVPKM
jgi:hypothetical protein